MSYGKNIGDGIRALQNGLIVAAAIILGLVVVIVGLAARGCHGGA